jgi:hypothetical protein
VELTVEEEGAEMVEDFQVGEIHLVEVDLQMVGVQVEVEVGASLMEEDLLMVETHLEMVEEFS